MAHKCFFCDIQREDDPKKIMKNKLFFSRFDDFPVSRGHAEVVPIRHISSICDLSLDEVLDFFHLLKETQKRLHSEFNPDGFNIGINEGNAAGQTIDHLHVHIIPRYKGDVENPKGGVRNIIPQKGDYTEEIMKIPSRRDYIR